MKLHVRSPEARLTLAVKLEVLEDAVSHLRYLVSSPGRAVAVDDEVSACMVSIWKELRVGIASLVETDSKEEESDEQRQGVRSDSA